MHRATVWYARSLLQQYPSNPLVWCTQLRTAMDATGHASTGIVVMDNGYYNQQEVAWAQANDTYRTSIVAAGLHDPCEFYYGPEPSARDLGWKLWASEDFSRDVTSWDDSQNYWGKALSQVRTAGKGTVISGILSPG